MITYGFYDSINHDRRYSAIQFGSIFDGIIRDGIYMSVGTCFRVIPGENMMLLVGVGRAWFNHTWTLNDAPFPIYLPQSEVLLNRIDAVVLDVNSNQANRKNDVIVVKGTPSSKPQRPTLINNTTRHQYPLAYVSVNAGVTAIRAADITNMVGTSATPYVTGILETVNIDALLDQWKDQWQRFYEKQTTEITQTNEFWKQEWQRFYTAQTTAIQNAYLEWEAWYENQTNEIKNANTSWANQWQRFYEKQTTEITQTNEFWKQEWQRFYTAQTTAIQNAYLEWEGDWELWSSTYKTLMEDTSEEWKTLWNDWFYFYTNNNQEMITKWQQNRELDFQTWFDSLKDLLDGDVATNLGKGLVELQQKISTLEEFRSNLITEHAVYDAISDSDSNYILDSNGQPIGGRTIFVTI